MKRRVVVTGMGGVCAFGEDWSTVKSNLLKKSNAVVMMPDWDIYNGLNTKLAAPVQNFELPDDIYNRKKTRSMGRVALFAVRSSEYALRQAGLLDDPLLGSGRVGVAYGSSTGNVDSVACFGDMILSHDTGGITGNTYVKMMPHTTSVNIAIFFGIKGRQITTSTACTSGSQAIGYAYEAIAYGLQDVMVAGGAEELSPTESAVFDTLFATSCLNDSPKLTPRPFDKDRDGLVIGEGAATLVLEEYEHAKARGATILAEVVGFASNCDASHITQPQTDTIEVCIRNSLKDAGIDSSAIGYINAHGTATDRGDIAESNATSRVFGSSVPFSSLKSYFGHTLGACGSLEAWLSIKMMNEGWFTPTINLNNVDPQCGELDYIMHNVREIDCEYIQSNNFAFGGINTSLVFRRL
ncbi:beta-ketoacyl-ACP synthase [Anaerobiospirillum succiniciproducens]|uniref:beta-ketoacyl-ACP synthase n=1 Tax=Anaerobiospirillum succiniciproducens TaxID=13335 RepID=UPI00248EAF30|nr:beta-ketoacyl-ACP synthase [Anaerobiospirillum succiniciproducens]